MLLQRVDERPLAHVLRQVTLSYQIAQGVSGGIIGVSEDSSGLFDGDLGGAVYQIHALQELCFVGSQLVLG